MSEGTEMCSNCGGAGWIDIYKPNPEFEDEYIEEPCSECEGRGVV